jgi:hypothetical protein
MQPDRTMAAVVFCSNEDNEDDEDNAAEQKDGRPRIRKMKRFMQYSECIIEASVMVN